MVITHYHLLNFFRFLVISAFLFVIRSGIYPKGFTIKLYVLIQLTRGEWLTMIIIGWTLEIERAKYKKQKYRKDKVQETEKVERTKHATRKKV